MTSKDEEISMKCIEIVRGIQRKAAVASEAHGISLEDAAIGSVYAAFDIAQRFKGDPYAGIEWLRTGIDVIERQLLTRETKQ